MNGTVLADSSGAFVVTGLPPASYVMFASVPSAPYLDPCIWKQTIRATVSAGATTGQNLALEKGVNLSIRVNDPLSSPYPKWSMAPGHRASCWLALPMERVLIRACRTPLWTWLVTPTNSSFRLACLSMSGSTAGTSL